LSEVPHINGNLDDVVGWAIFYEELMAIGILPNKHVPLLIFGLLPCFCEELLGFYVDCLKRLLA
jgi:hypothetical protein